jgi:hypothetical protein
MSRSKYDFAGKLNAGTAEVTRIASWWPRHSSSCVQYLLARVLADDDAARNAADILSDLASEWHKTVPASARRRSASAGGLMGDHSALEMALVDASVGGDAHAIERAAARLQENALVQREKYAAAIRDFPKDRFAALMKDHLSLFVEMVRCRISGDVEGAEACERLRNQNNAAMAAFVAEWF